MVFGKVYLIGFHVLVGGQLKFFCAGGTMNHIAEGFQYYDSLIIIIVLLNLQQPKFPSGTSEFLAIS